MGLLEYSHRGGKRLVGITFYLNNNNNTTTRPVISTFAAPALLHPSFKGSGRRHLSTLPLPCSSWCTPFTLSLTPGQRASISWQGTSASTLCPGFCNCCPVAAPWQTGSEARVPWTVTIREVAPDRVSNPKDTEQQQAKTNHQSFWKDPYLLFQKV